MVVKVRDPTRHRRRRRRRRRRCCYCTTCSRCSSCANCLCPSLTRLVCAVVRSLSTVCAWGPRPHEEMLQTRLDALHEAKLLSDDEIGAREDCVADYIDCRSSLNPAAAEIGVAAEKVKKMAVVSEGGEGRLARQLRRQFVLLGGMEE
jgi:hypothetical protein